MDDAQYRILVAFDGSLPALAAARLAFDLATQTGGTVRLLAVLSTREADQFIDRFGRVDHTAGERRETDLRIAVDDALRIGRTKGVNVESSIRTTGTSGESFEEILTEAGRWGAALIFMGRTSTRGPGRPLLGSQTAHVLEFSDVPVVVVPTGVDRRQAPDPS
jgi:nucleotide-binding universal stress UspA family protein